MGKTESCHDCSHFAVCKMHYRQKCELTYDTEEEIEYAMKRAEKESHICEHFQNKKRTINIPYPIKQGDKLFYVVQELNGEYHVAEKPDIVTAVLKDGFFVSTDGNKTFMPHKDDFYRWTDIGKEYQLTKKAAKKQCKKLTQRGDK